MDPKHLFPVLPEDLTSLDYEGLESLLEEFRAAARGIKNSTTDLTAFEAEDVVEQYRAGVVAIRAIENEMAERSAGVENFASTLAEIDEGVDLGDTEETPEVEEPVTLATEEVEELAVETEDPEVEETTEEPETVTASAKRLALPAAAKQHRPMVVEMEEAALSFVAAGGIPGVVAGSRLDRRGVAEAFMQARNSRTVLPEGFEDRMDVVHMDYSNIFPETNRLDADDRANMAKLDEIFTRENLAVVASGGLCAPYTNFYNVVSYGNASRPVRDALVSFQATRGGVNVPAGLSIADIDDGVGVVTAAHDAVGGTTGHKSCLVIDCPSYTPTAIEAIYACIQFGNLNSRAWPELIERFLNELDARHARVAETELLDGIAATSVTVTRALQYSGTSTILAGLLQAIAAYRYRLRADPELMFQVLLPDWLPEMLLNDLWNQQFNRFDITTEAQINALIRNAGADPAYYLDSPTDAVSTAAFSSSFETDGQALSSWPGHVFAYLFPPGTYIHLDMGELNLGIVRDSTLNASNDYQMFRETFENVAFVGVRSLEIDFTVTHSGELAPTGTYVA